MYKPLTQHQLSARTIEFYKTYGHVIKAHTEGKLIETKNPTWPETEWIECDEPRWYTHMQYRVKK